MILPLELLIVKQNSRDLMGKTLRKFIRPHHEMTTAALLNPGGSVLTNGDPITREHNQ